MNVMPHDNNAEIAVIGSLLTDNTCLDSINLAAGDFYGTANGLIFKAILELIESGKVADIITVCEHLNGSLKKVGGEVYVAGTVDNVVSTLAAGSYAKIVKEKAIERRIITEAQRMIEAVNNPGSSLEKLEEAQKTILNLSLSNEQDTLKPCVDIVKKTFSEIEKKYKNRGQLIGLSTGLLDLDNTISGLINGDLIILAGRPGTGKSAVAGNIAANVASDEQTVAIFSLEMPSENVMTRIIARESRINSRQLRSGFIQDTQWPPTINAAGNISKWPLFIDDACDITISQIRAKARKLKKEHNLSLLIVDYIQLIRPSGKQESREQAVADISRTLKKIARELNIPVLALSQLNRQLESRNDKHPILSDLRESGAIEQDADIIIFLYRDELYNKSEDNLKRGIIEFQIAKHRNGETANIEAIFEAKTQAIRNKARS
jgi:replicative DNA helicase